MTVQDASEVGDDRGFRDPGRLLAAADESVTAHGRARRSYGAFAVLANRAADGGTAA